MSAVPARWRRALWLLALLSIALTAWLLQPQRGGPLLLTTLGRTLDLELDATALDYRLRGTPQLTLDGLVVHRPGDPQPLLRVRRVYLALPWHTLLHGNQALRLRRLELDAPVLNLPALQRWLASRPAGALRLPRLDDGLRVQNGRIDAGARHLDQIDLDLPRLDPTQYSRLLLLARYRDTDAGLAIPARLVVTLDSPQALLAGRPAQLTVEGWLTPTASDWRLPMAVHVAGSLVLADGSLKLAPARLGLAGRYLAAAQVLPFRLGVNGSLDLDQQGMRLMPFVLRLYGDTAVPDLTAQGRLIVASHLQVQLQGMLADWPPAWPPLPSPLATSRAPLPFTLNYVGAADLSAPLTLTLRRDATQLQTRLAWPHLQTWLQAPGTGSPLPPLDGWLSAPTLDVNGIRLEGVELRIKDTP